MRRPGERGCACGAAAGLATRAAATCGRTRRGCRFRNAWAAVATRVAEESRARSSKLVRWGGPAVVRLSALVEANFCAQAAVGDGVGGTVAAS